MAIVLKIKKSEMLVRPKIKQFVLAYDWIIIKYYIWSLKGIFWDKLA